MYRKTDILFHEAATEQTLFWNISWKWIES